ncbi:cardiolipin synthase [Bacillus sp. HMF5848]|uniref:cardiolipin synthase n=1 Tax=Bacillus sp. HMF5848 TaxID=2495421 RepID=UPI000F7A488D|nr:cardiolipin synthase [Bacillus sp. HMF5848]RSK26486.1 cardiolipin synthase [Bacillus sp. HMF5848]
MKNYIRLLLLIGIISLVSYFTRQYWEGWLFGIISVIFTLSVIFIGFVIFFENRHPTQTLTWIIVLGSFPIVGFVFYILFGQNYRRKRLFEKKAIIDEETITKVESERDWSNTKINEMGEHQRLLFKLAQKLGKSPISFASETKVLTNGDETFTAIFDALKNAKHHIHLEYYIVRHDEVGQKLKNILKEKVQEGVKVRFLYDAVGSWRLSKDYMVELRNAGVEMVPFLPVKLPFLNNKINFRNHRKIIVVDGQIGFMGGLNVGDEYLGKNEYFGFWRDTHLYIRGEAVRSLQLIFLQDWYYMTGHSYLLPSYLTATPVETSGGGVQLIAGGPDNEWEIIKNLFFSMIVSARKSIWIATPYFIPDDDIATALKVAALSGIDVRIIVPERPDKRIVFYASRSYFPLLLEAGAKIYEYQQGFLHSKIIIVDNELASIGTSNMDMRSFHLNFEVNAFLFKTDSIEKLVSDFQQDLNASSQIHYYTFKKRPIWQRVFESTSRLLSPLL